MKIDIPNSYRDGLFQGGFIICLLLALLDRDWRQIGILAVSFIIGGVIGVIVNRIKAYKREAINQEILPDTAWFATSGLTLVFRHDEQVGPLQKPWIEIWAEWMLSKGIDPDGMPVRFGFGKGEEGKRLIVRRNPYNKTSWYLEPPKI